MQISARTPACAAMTAATIDHLSGGRLILGLGVSGPQVVEGWYGQPFARPLERTREVVDIVRSVLRRAEPLTSTGQHHPLPYQGPGAVGLGKPLKMLTHPVRGLENYADLFRHLTSGQGVIKVFCEVSEL